ncbi:MAG: helix-turn-helix transcriptional regulator [Lachnospiraceae bacterium]|nr:helix-turn-helix transcriptional regulator [Lachnospiraceae bacterium]
MKLKIGETIKRLRKEREITQEEFAEVLGVSCQSVSRWEKGICYPDMELVPTIAGFFSISVDKLLGVDEIVEKQTVDRYCRDFQKAISVGDIEECIRIAREGVAEFPNNYILLNSLMYALFVSGSDDADIPDWKENMEKYDGEIIALGERIMKYCPDVDIRMEATARLAFQHCEMGRKAIGRSIYESLPNMEWCRERAIWWALEEKERLPHTRKYMVNAYDHILDAMDHLLHLLPAEEAVNVLDKYYALENLMEDNHPRFATWGNVDNHCIGAKYLLQLGREKEAFEQLRIAAEAAIAYDNRPEEEKADSLLLGERNYKRIDRDVADSRPLRVILRDKELTEPEFDLVRERPEFQEIIKLLGE